MHALLIDGLNLIRRVHAGVPESEDSTGHSEAVEVACVASLQRALRRHQPSHVLCVMEYEGPSWRGTLFPNYKKNRRPMPDELRSALGQILSRFLAQGVGAVSASGFEADDVIASIARKVAEAGGCATVLSTDKSFFQLISNSVSVYDHFAAQDRSTEYVLQRFGVEPKNLTDLFALAGDSSLNIPGARGIGLRTAGKLLESYGNLESVLAEADKIPGSRGKKIQEAKEAVILAQRLVKLRPDVNVGVNLNQFRFSVK